MACLRITLLCVLLSAAGSMGQEVKFADAELERAVRDQLGVGSPVTAEQMLELTILKAEKRGIKSLEGLRHAKNLKKLYLRGNEISDISELANLKELVILFLGGNNITDISVVAGLEKLQLLRVDRNPLGGNVSAVSGLENLTELLMDDCGLTQLPDMSKLQRLRWLGIDDNEIADIGPVGDLEGLGILQACNNRIRDISVVAGLIDLRILQVWDNEITNISAAGKLDSLRELAFYNNRVRDISALANLKELEILGMDGNPLSDAAYDVIIPAIEANNPQIKMSYSPRQAQATAAPVGRAVRSKTFILLSIVAVFLLAGIVATVVLVFVALKGNR